MIPALISVMICFMAPGVRFKNNPRTPKRPIHYLKSLKYLPIGKINPKYNIIIILL